MIKKSIILLCVAGTAVSLLFLYLPKTPVIAATECGAIGPYATGILPLEVDALGIRADINPLTPALCDNADADSVVWVALEGNARCEYAQVGYGRDAHPSHTRAQIFSEYAKECGDNHFTRQLASIPTVTKRYKVRYIPRLKLIRMFADKLVVDATTTFDPAKTWEKPWRIEMLGETNFNGDDVPGTLENPVFFSNFRIQPCQGCAWVVPQGLTLDSTNSRYGWVWDANDRFHIWTKCNQPTCP
ncbi:MAG: hypothetical protein HY741_01990 [Chloroflexi bacterium]|nr:hypothetical protein [Chloroflexota bacterium]